MQQFAQNGYSDDEVIDALVGRSGSQHWSFRYELLDETLAHKADLTSVLAGDVSYDMLADIKRTARFTIRDTGEINYLSDRIKPWVRIKLPSESKTYDDVVEGIPSPLLRWGFDEAAGATVAVDSSGNNRDGTVATGGVSTGQPALLATGSAYNFTAAATGRVEYDDSSFLDGLSKLTVVAWVRPTATPTLLAKYVLDTADSAADTGISLSAQTTGKYAFFVHVDGQDEPLNVSTKNPTVAKAATTCIVATWQSGLGVKLWINGEPQDVELHALSIPQTTVGVTASTNPVRVGSSHNTNPAAWSWDGTIDDVALFDAYVDDTTARELYLTGVQTGRFGAANWAEWPQGVFLLSTPSRSADQNKVVTRDVHAYDQLQVLADDLVDNRYAAASGSGYTSQVAVLFNDAGLATGGIVHSPAAIPVTMEWEPGTSRLRICNDLLAAINYESLFFDENGLGIARPYQSPAERASEYTFAADSRSVIVPGGQQTLDLFGVANKWVLVVSDPDRAALVSTYTNNDPGSPTSTASRGRTIVDFRTEQDAADQATLDAKAERLAFEASQVFEEIVFETGLFPVAQNADVYTLRFPDLAVDDKYGERAWTLPLDAGGRMRRTIRRVVTV